MRDLLDVTPGVPNESEVIARLHERAKADSLIFWSPNTGSNDRPSPVNDRKSRG
jgi:hypothetical protein